MLHWEYNNLLFFFIVVLCIISFLVLLTFVLNNSTTKPSVKMPIECGSHALSSGRSSVEVNFYVISILFVIFEVEFIFLLPWTFYWYITYEYTSVLIFIFLIILILGLLFEYSQSQLTF